MHTNYKMGNEATMACFQVLSLYSSSQTEKVCQKSQWPNQETYGYVPMYYHLGNLLGLFENSIFTLNTFFEWVQNMSSVLKNKITRHFI